MQERARLEAEHEREHQKLSLAIKSALVIDNNQTEERITESSNAVTFDKELTSLKPLLTEGKALSNKDSNVKREKDLSNTAKKVQKNESESKHSEPEGNSFNAEEIRKRTEYLRKQRDKLLEIKKQEREKQMVKMEEQELLAKRPKSAKAMRSVVEDKKDEHLDDSDHSLAFRRSLAARLKAEVVGKGFDFLAFKCCLSFNVFFLFKRNEINETLIESHFFSISRIIQLKLDFKLIFSHSVQKKITEEVFI